LIRRSSRVGSPSRTISSIFSLADPPPPATELQLQYTNFKNTLQQLAQKIGDIEQEAEEHK
jgi:hypothetical protein